MWEKEYKKENFYWGKDPSKEVEIVASYAKKGFALDIGAGEGRNSIYLAKKGFKVTAIDKIKEGTDKLKKTAGQENLKIEVKNINIKDFCFPSEKYSLVISVASVDFLKFSEFKEIAEKIKISLSPGGILYLSVFSTADPFFRKLQENNFKMIEKNTFFLPKRNVFRHFFSAEELEDAFKDLKIIKNETLRFEDKGHGEPHFHNTINFIAQKKAA